MAKRISQLTNLTSASLDTTLLGVDAGVSYKIELDVLADAVKDRINTIDSIRLGSLENFTASFTASVASGTISGSSQLTSSFDTRYTLSGSVVNVNTSSLVNRLNAIESVSASWIIESETGSFLTSLNGTISSSSQLTASYDTRYTLSGSVQNVILPSDLISSSAQITAFGFVSSSTTIPAGTISGSSQLTSSFDTRYTLSGSVVSGTTPSGTISGSSQLTSSFDGRYVLETETGSLQTSITSLNTFSASENTKSTTLATYTSSLNIWTSSVATTGSNSFNGNQTITGSLVVSAVAVVNGGITVPTGSVITLTTGSSISVDSSGAITGSLTGSVFGIGDVVAFSSSVNSRIISGSVVAGTISSSAQLTTAFPSKTTGNWSVPAGASTQSLSLDANSSYTMWVNGNIPNGIITWNATATISNTNVPVLGAQYGWYYTVGNALVLTAMPDQFAGTNGSIATTPAAYAPNTSNVFKFGITNNSGTTQTINYGYIKLS